MTDLNFVRSGSPLGAAAVASIVIKLGGGDSMSWVVATGDSINKVDTDELGDAGCEKVVRRTALSSHGDEASVKDDSFRVEQLVAGDVGGEGVGATVNGASISASGPSAGDNDVDEAGLDGAVDAGLDGAVDAGIDNCIAS